MRYRCRRRCRFRRRRARCEHVPERRLQRQRFARLRGATSTFSDGSICAWSRAVALRVLPATGALCDESFSALSSSAMPDRPKPNAQKHAVNMPVTDLSDKVMPCAVPNLSLYSISNYSPRASPADSSTRGGWLLPFGITGDCHSRDVVQAYVESHRPCPNFTLTSIPR